MFDDLSDLSDSPASYLAVFALVALDAVFPVAPSETALVSGGILIERARPRCSPPARSACLLPASTASSSRVRFCRLAEASTGVEMGPLDFDAV